MSKKNGCRKLGPDDVMTLKETAGYLGLHVMTVYKLTREGKIPAAKIGGQWRFKHNIINEWLESQMRQNADMQEPTAART